MSEVKLSPKDLNKMWADMLSHRSVIRDSMIKYAVKIGVGECDEWKNPFRIHLDNYDDSIITLQSRLTGNLVSSIIYEKAPNLDIDPEFVLSRMVDALTDQDTETTVYDKPLVFDAQWIIDYVDKTYIRNRKKLCLSQMLNKINHLASDIVFDVHSGKITLPFYTGKWFKNAYIVSSGTEKLMLELDKLIQTELCGRNYFDVSPNIFTEFLDGWSRVKPYSKDIFKEMPLNNEYDGIVRSIKIHKDKSKMDINFVDWLDVQILIDVINKDTN